MIKDKNTISHKEKVAKATKEIEKVFKAVFTYLKEKKNNSK